MAKPAARVTDMHSCPMSTPATPPIPHVGGPILPPCSTNILIGNLPAARLSDKALCITAMDAIVQGSATVLFNNLPAARMGDMTTHGGAIISGMVTVLIGDSGGGLGIKVTKPCMKSAANSGAPFVKG